MICYMGKFHWSQNRLLIPGARSILAQPAVRMPLCQGRRLGTTLYHSSRRGEEEEEEVVARGSSLFLPALGKQPESALPPALRLGSSSAARFATP